MPQTTGSRAAQVLLDKLCALYYEKKAKYTDNQRYEKLRYDMLVLAIDGALPEHSSAMVSVPMPGQLNSIECLLALPKKVRMNPCCLPCRQSC